MLEAPPLHFYFPFDCTYVAIENRCIKFVHQNHHFFSFQVPTINENSDRETAEKGEVDKRLAKILYQAGFLTIKKYDESRNIETYCVGIVNKEAESVILEHFNEITKRPSHRIGRNH